MSVYMEAGDPRRHGYAQCHRCGTWLRPERLGESPAWGPDRPDFVVCLDTAWCSKAANVGKGELTGDTGDVVAVATAAWHGADCACEGCWP